MSNDTLKNKASELLDNLEQIARLKRQTEGLQQEIINQEFDTLVILRCITVNWKRLYSRL